MSKAKKVMKAIDEEAPRGEFDYSGFGSLSVRIRMRDFSTDVISLTELSRLWELPEHEKILREFEKGCAKIVAEGKKEVQVLAEAIYVLQESAAHKYAGKILSTFTEVKKKYGVV